MSTPENDPRVDDTPGRADLAEWLEAPFVEPPGEGEPKKKIPWLAKQLDVTPTAIRNWSSRLSRPTEGELRNALCRLIGSDPERWVTKEDRERAEYLARVGAA